MTEQDLCRCGHQREAHEHYRAGTDCSLCPGQCLRFEAAQPAASGSLFTRVRRTVTGAGARRF